MWSAGLLHITASRATESNLQCRQMNGISLSQKQPNCAADQVSTGVFCYKKSALMDVCGSGLVASSSAGFWALLAFALLLVLCCMCGVALAWTCTRHRLHERLWHRLHECLWHSQKAPHDAAADSTTL